MRLYNKQNRKVRRTPWFPIQTPVVFVLLIMAALALCHLWINDRCDSLGSRIKLLEHRKVLLHNRVQEEEARFVAMKSPANITRLLQQFHIVMDWPYRTRVLWLPASLNEEEFPLSGHRRYAQYRDARMND